MLANELKTSTGKKGRELFHPLRLALTGRESGPEMAPLLGRMGKERALRRLEAARYRRLKSAASILAANLGPIAGSGTLTRLPIAIAPLSAVERLAGAQSGDGVPMTGFAERSMITRDRATAAEPADWRPSAACPIFGACPLSRTPGVRSRLFATCSLSCGSGVASRSSARASLCW